MGTQVCQCLCRKFLFGSTSDLKEQLNYIQSLFPTSDLYAVGSSAGTGLLVRYLGEQGEDTPLKLLLRCARVITRKLVLKCSSFYSKMMTKNSSSILFIRIKIRGAK